MNPFEKVAALKVAEKHSLEIEKDPFSDHYIIFRKELITRTASLDDALNIIINGRKKLPNIKQVDLEKSFFSQN